MSPQRELEAQGFVTVRNGVTAAQRLSLLRILDPDRLVGATKHRSGLVFAARHLMATMPELRAELLACGLDALASSFLGASAFPVDATYFDKQSTANWAVPVHQDRILPVLPDAERAFRRARGVAVAEVSSVEGRRTTSRSSRRVRVRATGRWLAVGVPLTHE